MSSVGIGAGGSASVAAQSPSTKQKIRAMLKPFFMFFDLQIKFHWNGAEANSFGISPETEDFERKTNEYSNHNDM